MKMIGYVNGKEEEFDALEVINCGKEFYLRMDAGVSFNLMSQKAEESGVCIKINYAFRTMGLQTKLYESYQRRIKEWESRGPGRDDEPKPTPVARPGYSKHQSGVALDISMEPATKQWLISNAAKYGWFQTVMPSEPWHWEFKS